MDRKQYEDDLKKRQGQHLANIFMNNNANWQPCMHDQCTDCHGTGIKANGASCIHGISCPCPRCTPSYQTFKP